MIGLRAGLQSKTRRAITLFELSVVITIALILMGLAFFSVRGIATRAKISRVQEDQRVLVRAIQNYAMDYASFPSRKQGLAPLTHPTAYLGQLPHDPFQKPGAASYFYLSSTLQDTAMVLISPGPDGDLDLPADLVPFLSRENIDLSLLPNPPILADAAAGNGQRLTPQRAEMSEAQLAILNTYINLAQYSPEKGNDGDIITIVRY